MRSPNFILLWCVRVHHPPCLKIQAVLVGEMRGHRGATPVVVAWTSDSRREQVWHALVIAVLTLAQQIKEERLLRLFMKDVRIATNTLHACSDGTVPH